MFTTAISLLTTIVMRFLLLILFGIVLNMEVIGIVLTVCMYWNIFRKRFNRRIIDMNIQKLYETDKEFMDIFENFAFNEVVNEKGQELDDETRYIAILSALLGCQGK